MTARKNITLLEPPERRGHLCTTWVAPATFKRHNTHREFPSDRIITFFRSEGLTRTTDSQEGGAVTLLVWRDCGSRNSGAYFLQLGGDIGRQVSIPRAKEAPRNKREGVPLSLAQDSRHS